MTSIRRTLLVTLLAAITLVTAAAGAVVYRVTRGELDAVFDYHLRQVALSLRDQVLGRAVARGAAPAPDLDLVIQVWDVDGTALYASAYGPPEVTELGFTTFRSSQGDWRVYAADLAGQVIQVAQPLRVRQRLALSASTRMLAPVVLTLPLLAILVWSIVGRALAPLDRLAGAVKARTPAALEPVPEAGAPDEAVPLVRALNDLLARLATTLDAQRAFVADAAHELRTPLAALQLQLQLVERAEDADARAAALADLRDGLARATHVVQQLLTLAREEPHREPGGAAGGPVALAELVGQAVADHAVLAEAKRIDLGAAQIDERAVVRGDAAALRVLLANLVDNAVRYTPEGGRIDVSAATAEGRPYLEVTDTGPGIPPAERGRVLDRFYRRSGTSEAGAGLGLSIVKAIADRHGAAIEMADGAGGGLTFRVVFPGGVPAPGSP